MKKVNKNIIIISIVLSSVILAVIGYVVLPDTLVMQFTPSGEAGTTMPKILGLVVPLFITVTFSILFYKNKDSKKHLIIALIGLLIYAFIFIFNLK